MASEKPSESRIEYAAVHCVDHIRSLIVDGHKVIVDYRDKMEPPSEPIQIPESEYALRCDKVSGSGVAYFTLVKMGE